MNRHPLHPIGSDEASRFEQDGVVCIREVFDREWIERMNGAVDRLLANPGARAREATATGNPGRFHMNVFMWRWDPDFRAFALNSPLPELAATLMRQDKVSLFYDQAFVKEAGTREVTQWHHDLPFWPARGNDIISLWVALTHVTVEGSGVEYVAGSHRWGKFYRAATPDEDPRFSSEDLEPCPDFSRLKNDGRYRFLSWECAPGDVICHHPLVVHGASGNALDRRRAAISVRYAGADARWDPRPKVMRVEGEPEARLRPGDPLVLDGVFPVAWERQSSFA
ncbi:MAG TPA: phytanoyl-CoA dioxygenase family protein [Hyphomicrobiales bacterium]|nr:phytanoyl-CoA dioxygenase family protein [Hyphomicrobiales bacterium]